MPPADAQFIQAMMLFPEVQKRCHDELDRIVGSDRLPTIEDFESLPYIRQTAKEALRCRPSSKPSIGYNTLTELATGIPTAISGAIPHAALADDVIDGYVIPKGATVVLAVWSANNDPVLFPNPREFQPERHDPNLSFSEAAAAADFRKRDNWTFGAGRRICPGIHIAERTLFLSTARILWTFDIHKSRDQFGQEIEVERDGVTQSIAARPIPFP